MWLIDGWGVVSNSPAPPASVLRKCSSRFPISVNTDRAAFRTVANDSRACCGCFSIIWDATPALRLITEIWCATVSCKSRAIRSRSSVTRRAASDSRVCSARIARSVMALI